MAEKQNEHEIDLPQLSKDTITMFQYTIEQSPLAVFWLKRNGRFAYVNDQACKSLGYTREELLSLYLWDIDTNFPKERWDTQWEELRKVNKRTFETSHTRKDGHSFPIEVSAYQVHYEGKEFHAAFVKDITELKKARAEQANLEEQLQQARKLEAIGTLAGGIAHDFNNMLSVIIGYSELLKNKISSDNVALKDLLEIESAALRSRDIVRQLLAFSRKQVVSPVSLNINKRIISTLELVKRLIGEQIELEFNADEEIHNIKIDPSQFDQILINLSVNARDAMPRGGKLTILTSNRVLNDTSLRFSMDASPGQYVLMSVRDTGIGMDKDTLSHVFEPFFTTKELGQGTGLGLATTYGIIRQNNGIINVKSGLGQGSVFDIYFPVTGDVDEDEIADKGAVASGTGVIMLVEDDDMVRNMTSKMLEAMGYTVLTFSNPLDAISFCKTKHEQIDLLFTDIAMPKMNGIELGDKIKALKPEIKVLFMSGYSPTINTKNGVDSEEVHLIQKPFRMSDLALRIAEIIEQ